VNYLAHLLIADRLEACPLGTLMGDHVKGPLDGRLTPEIRTAVALHRRVDGYTDGHPAFRHSKRRLSPRFGHYAAILVDVFYDHCLALRWNEHSEEPLDRFAGRVYAVLRQRREQAPEALRPLIDGMRRVDLLTAYREPRGVERALGNISRRLTRSNSLHRALPDLEAHRVGLDADFATFFPELLAHLGAPPATTTRQGAAPRPKATHGPV
jgi:acyl carrier protein phosphodiesterase